MRYIVVVVVLVILWKGPFFFLPAPRMTEAEWRRGVQINRNHLSFSVNELRNHLPAYDTSRTAQSRVDSALESIHILYDMVASIRPPEKRDEVQRRMVAAAANCDAGATQLEKTLADRSRRTVPGIPPLLQHCVSQLSTLRP